MPLIPALAAPAPNARRVFVYGTLLSGYVPHDEAALVPPPTLRAARKVGAAVLRGFELYELDRYCCIVKTENSQHVVHGELYEIADHDVDWKILDEYEGISEQEEKPYEYRRETVTVELKEGGGNNVGAQAYVYNRDDADKLKKICSGNFVDFYNDKASSGGR